MIKEAYGVIILLELLFHGAVTLDVTMQGCGLDGYLYAYLDNPHTCRDSVTNTLRLIRQ